MLSIDDAKVEADHAFDSSKIGPHNELAWRCFIGVLPEQHESVVDKTSEFFKLKMLRDFNQLHFLHFYFQLCTLKTIPA